MLAVLLLSGFFRGILSQTPHHVFSALSSSHGSLHTLPDNIANFRNIVPVHVFANPLEQPNIPSSVAIRQISPIDFTPNFDNTENFLQNAQRQHLISPPRVEQNLITANHPNSLGMSENNERGDWEPKTDHPNRIIAPTALSSERDLPPWIADSVSDRFKNPFLSRFLGSQKHRATETPERNGNFKPLTVKLNPTSEDKTESSTADHHRSVVSEKHEGSEYSPVNPTEKTTSLHPKNEDFGPQHNNHVPGIDFSFSGGTDVGSADINTILDTMFQNLGSKQPCSLKLFPVYKVFMETLIKEVLNGYISEQEQGELFVMLWRDLKICRHIRMSETNSLIKRLQTFDKSESRNNYFKAGKVQSYKNLKRKKEYVRNLLSKRYKFYEESKRQFERGNRKTHGSPSYPKRGKASSQRYLGNGGPGSQTGSKSSKGGKSNSQKNSQSSQGYSNGEGSSSQKNSQNSQGYSNGEGSSSQKNSQNSQGYSNGEGSSSQKNSQNSQGYSNGEGSSSQKNSQNSQGYSNGKGSSAGSSSQKNSQSSQGYSNGEGSSSQDHSNGAGSSSQGYSNGEGSSSQGYSNGEGSSSQGYSNGEGSSSQDHSNGAGSSSQDHSNGAGSSSQGYSNGEGSSSQGYSNGEGSSSQGYSNGEGSSSQDHSNGEGSSSQDHSNGAGSSSQGYSNGEGSSSQDHSNGEGSSSQDHSNGAGSSSQGYSNGEGSSSQDHSNGAGSSSQGYSNGAGSGSQRNSQSSRDNSNSEGSSSRSSGEYSKSAESSSQKNSKSDHEKSKSSEINSQEDSKSSPEHSNSAESNSHDYPPQGGSSHEHSKQSTSESHSSESSETSD